MHAVAVATCERRDGLTRASCSFKNQSQIYRRTYFVIVIALDGMRSSAILSLFCLFFGEVAVGVGGSDESDRSAPTRTAPQQVRFCSNRDCGVDKVFRGPHDDGLG